MTDKPTGGLMPPVFIPEGYYHTVPEAANILQESRRNITNWLKSEYLKGVKTGTGWQVEATQLNGFQRPQRGRPLKITIHLRLLPLLDNYTSDRFRACSYLMIFFGSSFAFLH